jgi:hypothetical protein
MALLPGRVDASDAGQGMIGSLDRAVDIRHRIDLKGRRALGGAAECQDRHEQVARDRCLSPILLALFLATYAAALAAAQEVAVDLELVLAVDVSSSIDPVEAAQQRQGYITAITDPAVVSAVRSTPTGRVAMTYIEWAGPLEQNVVVPWTLIQDEASANAFAAPLAGAPMRQGKWTSISDAIDFSVPLFDKNGFAGRRRAIDISGDGVSNHGRTVTRARDEAVAKGIVINGLPILNDRPQPMGTPTPAEIALDRYYVQNVIGGPGSFTVPVPEFDAFKDAILQKLTLEIAGNGPAPLARRRGPHLRRCGRASDAGGAREAPTIHAEGATRAQPTCSRS